MSSDNEEDAGDFDGEAPPTFPPTVDERGFPIGSAPIASGGGGRLVATANPLQLKLERQKREAEEKAKAAAKKASLQTRLAAFGGGASADPSPKSPAASAAASPAAPPAAPLSAPAAAPEIDSRVANMMKSACAALFCVGAWGVPRCSVVAWLIRRPPYHSPFPPPPLPQAASLQSRAWGACARAPPPRSA